MKSRWKSAKIGELLSLSRETVEISPLETYKQVTVRLHHKGVVLRGEVSGQTVKSNQYLARQGQFIISRIDARNGAMGIVPKELDGAIVTNDFLTYDIDASRLHPKYLDYLTSTDAFVSECRQASEGTTNRVRLEPEIFAEIEIPLPPLDEQQRIAAILDRLMERIDEARRQREAAMEAIKVFKKTSAQEYLNKKDYPHKSIATLCDIISGGTPSKSNPDYWDGSIPWVRPKNMKNKEILDSDAHITENALKETNIKLLEPDTVLIVVRGMIMVHTVPSAVLKNRAVINQDMKGLVVNDSLLPEYLCACLWIYNDKLLSLVEKSGHGTRRLPTESLLNFTIPVPTLFEQRQLLANLSALNGKIKEIQHLQITSKNDLEDLIPSLLQKAFAGEL